MSRRWGWTLGLVGISCLIWGGTRTFSAWRFEAGLAHVRALMDAHEFNEARAWLIGLSPRWADQPEAAYRLGVCEHTRHDFPAALAAWSRITKGNDWRDLAILASAKTLIGDLGRFADAETLLEPVLVQPAGPSKTRDELRAALVQLYFWEGRRDAASRLLEAGFRNTAQPADDLRSHWLAENAATLVEPIRVEVEAAAKCARR